MARKKHQNTPPKPLQFTSAPFRVLKGVTVLSEPVSVELPAKQTPPVQSEENGSDIFLQAMAGTKRLHDTAHIRDISSTTVKSATGTQANSKVSKSPDEIIADELFKQEIGRLKLEVKFTEQVPDEDELKPLVGNRLKQLKRGIITVDHQLDLHGLTRDEALAELPRFLRSARLRGQVAALVITGKGLNSSSEPVLQQAVAAWLRDAGRELVVEYAPAPREMGGSGAFVVFLRPISQKSLAPT
jgi:DNA-nicking Smr family endonuclease